MLQDCEGNDLANELLCKAHLQGTPNGRAEGSRSVRAHPKPGAVFSIRCCTFRRVSEHMGLP